MVTKYSMVSEALIPSVVILVATCGHITYMKNIAQDAEQVFSVFKFEKR